jgi:hypothetical protein
VDIKNKCAANTQEHLYFIDSAHLSKKGSQFNTCNKKIMVRNATPVRLG